MNKDMICEALEKLKLSEEAKEKIKRSCYEYEKEREKPRIGFKILVAVGAAVVFCVGAFAATKLINFSITENNDEVKINASISDDSDTEKPIRAWNSDSEEGEISVKLEFDYMPSDLSEDPTATHKYSGSSASRAVTFTGHDLRINDLENVIGNIDSAEKFIAGDKEAYLLISDSLSVYNKDIYVLFEEEELIVHGMVGYGITAEEIKAIAEGMKITETADINIALPIANELSENRTDIPFVFKVEPLNVYRDDLLYVGEDGKYKDEFSDMTLRVDGFEIFDRVTGFEDGFINREFAEKFTNDEGELIAYNRAEAIISEDISAGEKPKISLGETVVMKKVFVCVTVTASGDTDENMKPFLHTLKLGGLVETDDGIIERTQKNQRFLIDGVPGENAATHEPVYCKKAGDGKWILGYLIDEDEIVNELYFYSEYAELHYVLNK